MVAAVATGTFRIPYPLPGRKKWRCKSFGRKNGTFDDASKGRKGAYPVVPGRKPWYSIRYITRGGDRP